MSDLVILLHQPERPGSPPHNVISVFSVDDETSYECTAMVPRDEKEIHPSDHILQEGGAFHSGRLVVFAVNEVPLTNGQIVVDVNKKVDTGHLSRREALKVLTAFDDTYPRRTQDPNAYMGFRNMICFHERLLKNEM